VEIVIFSLKSWSIYEKVWFSAGLMVQFWDHKDFTIRYLHYANYQWRKVHL